MAQEQKESIDRTFDQFMQPDLGFRTGVFDDAMLQFFSLISYLLTISDEVSDATLGGNIHCYPGFHLVSDFIED